MLKYILKRIGYSILVLLGVSLIIYCLVRLMPIDYVLNKVQAIEASGASMTPEQMKTMYEAYGLSGGILEGYFKIGRASCRERV